jgi:hypothetical protein
MSVSKDQDTADTNAALDSAELTASQLDQVSGGDPVVVKPVTNNQATTAQKAADKTDAYIRS